MPLKLRLKNTAKFSILETFNGATSPPSDSAPPTWTWKPFVPPPPNTTTTTTAAVAAATANQAVPKPARLPGFGSDEYWAAQPPPPAWSHYPPPLDIPENADGTTQSFSVGDPSGASFFHEWGFVVYHDVLSPSDCTATISEIWDQIETTHPTVSRTDIQSYDDLPVQRYGLPDEQAIFSPQIVRNRQNRKVYEAIDSVTPRWVGHEDAPAVPPTTTAGVASTATANSLVMSADRWCLYPPSLGHPSRQTNNPGAHIDVCPWSYLPRPDRRFDSDSDLNSFTYERGLFDFRAEINCIPGEAGPNHQGVLNLLDNAAEDGGTAVVPQFHSRFEGWSRALGRFEDNRVGQRRRGNAYVFANPLDPIHGLMRRVTMLKGSLLLWDQRTVHGAVPNRSGNFRIAQFIRGTRRGLMTEERAKRRRAKVKEEMEKAKSLDALGELGLHVFDLMGVVEEKGVEEEEEELFTCVACEAALPSSAFSFSALKKARDKLRCGECVRLNKQKTAAVESAGSSDDGQKLEKKKKKKKGEADGETSCTTVADVQKLAKGSAVIVLNVTADWCTVCQKIKKFWRSLPLDPALQGVTFREVDADLAPDLVAEYNVSGLPHFVVLKKGKVVDTMVGAKSATLKKIVAKAMK
jgi:thiol-disulfide isomerase/thioredoxin